jgi:hypothetical protein
MKRRIRLILGVDSWNPPTQEAIDALKVLDGFGFWAGYIGGTDLYLNKPWPKEAWDLLKSNNIKPLPIWVPSQNCTDNPKTVAQQAIAAATAMGLTEVVAIDSEYSMSASLNFASFLDQIFEEIVTLGWLAVNYAGAHYLSPKAFSWSVMWGEHEQVPLEGEAIQYGPYRLSDASGHYIMDVDSDSADDSFPFAGWVGVNPQPKPEPNPAPTPAPEPIEGEENLPYIMNDGHTQFVVSPPTASTWTKKEIASPTELNTLAKVFTPVTEPVPDFLTDIPVVS